MGWHVFVVDGESYPVHRDYPNLSKKYDRSVCMAGIDMETVEWIRMYPVPYFDLPFNQRPHKFDVIEVLAERNLAEKFQRKESHKIKSETIKRLGNISTEKGTWKRRNEIISALIEPSLEVLQKKYEADKTSLGFIKPQKITDFYAEPISEAREWERELVEGRQHTLANSSYKSPLDKIPFRFAYKFNCDDKCKGHDLMVEDWELLALYRFLVKKGDSKEVAVKKCIQKYKDEFLSKRDVGFFVGTESSWNNWLIIGVYYPPKQS